MINIAPVATETQAQPKFKKENLMSDLKCTSEKLGEMAALFQMIHKLVEEGNTSSMHTIKRLAGLGWYSCEDWAAAVECFEESLQNNSSSYYH